ncbi:hypothetical protein JTB14_019044 [Gonioctena quinquepunctata]|nr:hypothetical protein JTB14_019044 [Gonioctena quinquepunctata]
MNQPIKKNQVYVLKRLDNKPDRELLENTLNTQFKLTIEKLFNMENTLRPNCRIIMDEQPLAKLNKEVHIPRQIEHNESVPQCFGSPMELRISYQKNCALITHKQGWLRMNSPNLLLQADNPDKFLGSLTGSNLLRVNSS